MARFDDLVILDITTVNATDYGTDVFIDFDYKKDNAFRLWLNKAHAVELAAQLTQSVDLEALAKALKDNQYAEDLRDELIEWVGLPDGVVKEE